MAQRIKLKSMLIEEQKLSEQVAVKLSKNERGQVQELSDHYKVSTSKILRTAIGVMHKLMLEELKADGVHKFEGVKHNKPE
jgi:hypothetical protein